MTTLKKKKKGLSSSREFRSEGNRSYSLTQFEDHAVSKAQKKRIKSMPVLEKTSRY